jgi:hypothetical protein
MGDWYSDWSHKVEDALRQVQQSNDLPKAVISGSDGAAWVWMWRWDDHERVGELRVRARPDELEEGAEFEVVSSAWLEHDRETSLSRLVWAGYLPYYDERWSGLGTMLGEHVREAATGMPRMLNQLSILRSRREQALSIFPQRGPERPAQ